MRRSLSLALVLLFAGCATLKNSPIQDYVLEVGRQCESVNAVRIVRVDTAGHYWIRGAGPAGIPLFQACMKEQYAKQPFNDWLKAQRGDAPGAMTARSESPGPSPVPPASGSAAAVAAITEWKPGYQWAFRYESPRESGTFAWTVNREEAVDGIPYYVVASGSREIYFRKSDFAHHMDKVNGEVEVRNTPPVRLASGSAGEKWESRYTRETPKEQSTQNMLRTCESSGPEAVTVPAGTYDATKTTCMNTRTGEIVYEVWYSQTVKQMVRERMRFSYGWRERELIGVRLHPDRVQ